MIVALTSDIYDRGKLYDAASTILEQRLSQLQGVGQVTIGGGALPFGRAQVNPTLLENFGLWLAGVGNMLSRPNPNVPKGQLSHERPIADIFANAHLLRAALYK